MPGLFQVNKSSSWVDRCLQGVYKGAHKADQRLRHRKLSIAGFVLGSRSKLHLFEVKPIELAGVENKHLYSIDKAIASPIQRDWRDGWARLAMANVSKLLS